MCSIRLNNPEVLWYVQNTIICLMIPFLFVFAGIGVGSWDFPVRCYRHLDCNSREQLRVTLALVLEIVHSSGVWFQDAPPIY